MVKTGGIGEKEGRGRCIVSLFSILCECTRFDLSSLLPPLAPDYTWIQAHNLAILYLLM